MSVSVIICSHNGRARISSTLEALAQCETKFPVEIILVDNASTDEMAQTARAVWERLGSPFEFRIIFERQLGKSYALRRGAKEARYELVVICDDDNWLSPNYLSLVIDILADPSTGAVSGQAEPVFEGPVPSFVYSHGYWLALGIQALSSGDVTHSRGYLWGAGLALRRSDLLTVYQCPGLPILTGPAGVLSAARGEDNELCWALTVLGKTLVYDERLRLRHFMPKERLQISYLKKRAANGGAAWDEHICRFTAELNTMRNKRSRVDQAIRSAIRWVRHFNWPNERRYQECMFLAACGWKSRMSDVERRLYVAFEWLRCAGGTNPIGPAREETRN
jgi:glycosyltransferase involved in cell wall biosynthesis